MKRIASLFALAAFLTCGLGTAFTYADEPAPAEQKEKKDSSGSKASADDEKKDDKKDKGGK